MPILSNRPNARHNLGTKAEANTSSTVKISAAPLFICIFWWVFCYTLFFMGWPIPYRQTNLLQVTLIFFASGLAMSIGYYSFSYKPKQKYSQARAKPSRWLPIGVTASAILVVPIVATYSGFSIDQFSEALNSQGDAFALGTERINEGSNTRLTLLAIQTLLAPVTLVALPYAAYYWFYYHRGLAYFVVALLIPIVTSIFLGRDQQLGWSAIMVGIAWLLARYRNEKHIRLIHLLVTAIAGSVFFLFFAIRKSSRGNATELCLPGADTCISGDIDANLIEVVMAYSTSYATQGLEGLGRAFDTTWFFGGGLSHSPALHSILAGPLHLGAPNTVSAQLWNVEWSPTWYWSTAFTTLANDIPWLLIPLLFFLVGVLFRASWERSLVEGDYLSVGVFALTMLTVLFVPQNLQIVQSGPTYIGFWALVLLFIGRGAHEEMTRRRARNSI